jgi:hypothetical protein
MKKLYTIACFLIIFVGQLSDIHNDSFISLREVKPKRHISNSPVAKQNKIERIRKNVVQITEPKDEYFYFNHCMEIWDKNISIRRENFRSMLKKKLGPIVYAYMTGEDVSLVDKEPQTKEELLFMGLAYANLIANSSGNFIDYEKAEKYLTMSYLKDTKNSAPLAFLAIIKKKKGELSHVKKLLQKIKSTTYFKTHELKINNHILKLVRSPDDYLVRIKFIANQHFPEYRDLSDMLKEEKDHVVASQLIANSLNPKAKFQIDFDPFRYAFGRSILRKVSNVNLPNSNALWDKARQEIEYITHIPRLDSTCKIEDLTSYVKLHQYYAFN